MSFTYIRNENATAWHDRLLIHVNVKVSYRNIYIYIYTMITQTSVISYVIILRDVNILVDMIVSNNVAIVIIEHYCYGISNSRS